jgi:hypothetical protein
MADKDPLFYLKVPFLTSSVSGAISLIIYPLDLLNTVVKASPQLRSISDTMKNLYRTEGLRGFYKGTGTLLFENFSSNMIYFFLYDYLNKTLSRKYEERNMKHRWTIPMITSFASEIGCLAVYVPCDTVLTRMQSHSSVYRYRSLFHGLKSIVKDEGLIRLFHSSYLFIISCLIYTTTQFSVYEWLKSYHNHSRKEKKFGLKESIAATIGSTSIAVLISNPLDTLVIKHQMTNFVLEKDQHILKIVGEEMRSMGLWTFTKGLPLRLVSLNAAALALLPFYEIFRQKFGVEVDF